ncbi:MAG TPA: hypothetical protein VNA87_06395 [Actinomycetota bacterium]|nr:hypothetical protein [Actinomycetota bacterium]
MANEPLLRPGDWIGIGGLIIALVAVLLSGWIGVRQQRLADRTRRQERAADALGPVIALLSDVNPERWAFAAGPGARDITKGWWDRWLGRIREPLLAVAAGYPSERERTLALKLSTAIHNTIVSSSGFGVALPGADPPWTYERAKDDHKEAVELLGELTAVMRGERKNTVIPRSSLDGAAPPDPM